eukprot:TRINITY_DN76138_c0_g1_i1.p1 TRINITY_DN76138_c0_g1~~TRINITY_DN76138_c0_g1_i1.p1  ORF type:complete len:764 (+),score=178.46 TRINITY_DN76138_c0_g1_i1:147-2438(+)
MKSQKDIVQVTVKSEESDVITEKGGYKYYADFHALLTKPVFKEVSVQGPRRDVKADAIKDSDTLNAAFQAEGEAGLRRVAEQLEKMASAKLESPDPGPPALRGIFASHQSQDAPAAPGRLIPPGEGWARFNDDMLREPRSEVYFAQQGAQAGKYLMKDAKTGQFQTVNAPHVSSEIPIAVRAGGSNILRKGAKLDRSVLLPDLKKIARLAMKFPLSFLDSPSSAFALFQGIRSAEAADWCAKNFHTKLIPQLAKKIHTWETQELRNLLEKVLQELDAEVLKSSSAYSGCSAILALLIGDRLAVSVVGQARVVLLFDDGSSRQLLESTSDISKSPELERVAEARGILHGGLLYGCPGALELNDAQKILAARTPFQVFQLDAATGFDEKQVKTAYRKLALKVHPDKRTGDADLEVFNKAFARLESAKETLEGLVTADRESVKELIKVLKAEVHTREGAAELLGVDGTPQTETEALAEEAAKSSRFGIKKLEKLEAVANALYQQAVAIYKEAVETLRRPASKEALPRQEALRLQPLPCSRALGVRDMRFPAEIVEMKPESSSWIIPRDKSCRVALLCGATAVLEDKVLSKSSSSFKRCPKASALRWCQEASASSSSVAACLRLEGQKGQQDAGGPPGKRQKTAAGQPTRDGTIFLRHILFRHQQLKVMDQSARREGTAKGPGEAEAAAMEALQKLLANPNLFIKMCRELSDCATAEQPGNLVGHIGWVARGEIEQSMEEAGFALAPNEFGDIIATSRGIHVLQRIG